jgi:hypothetical protein
MAAVREQAQMGRRPARRASRARVHQTCIAALERGGIVTPEALVRAARNPNHPMHPDFEWNDRKAGHKHRLDQARTFIAAVRVTITTSTRTVKAPAYVRDPLSMPHIQGYIRTQSLQANRNHAIELLLYETTRLQALVERCREIGAALDLEAELDSALVAIHQLQGRIRRRQTLAA